MAVALLQRQLQPEFDAQFEAVQPFIQSFQLQDGSQARVEVANSATSATVKCFMLADVPSI